MKDINLYIAEKLKISKDIKNLNDKEYVVLDIDYYLNKKLYNYFADYFDDHRFIPKENDDNFFDYFWCFEKDFALKYSHNDGVTIYEIPDKYDEIDDFVNDLKSKKIIINDLKKLN